MKRNALLRHLRRFGCYLKREGSAHSIWCNRETGEIQAIPRHGEIPNRLADRICKALSVPMFGSNDLRENSAEYQHASVWLANGSLTAHLNA